jgi:hypothetical protein
MHAVFGTCPLGGFVATVLQAALGALGTSHAYMAHLTPSERPRSKPRPRAAMAAFVRASTPPLHGDAAGAVGTLSAPLRVDAPDEALYAGGAAVRLEHRCRAEEDR